MASLSRHRYRDVRPDNFRINRRSPLWSSAQFLGLGQHAVRQRYFNSRSRGPRGPHGTLTNMDPATGWVWSDELGRWCLTFDGSNDHVSVHNNDSSVSITPDAWKSLSLWFRCAGNDTEAMMGNPGGYSDSIMAAYGYGLCIKSDSTVRLVAGNNNTGSYDNVYGAFPANEWTHVLTTVSGSGTSVTAKMYVNGTLAADWTGTIGMYALYADSFALGCGANTSALGGQYFSGELADAMAWDRVLSASEAEQLADPSNAMLSGLLLPPSRVLWPAAVADSTYPSTIELPATYITI